MNTGSRSVSLLLLAAFLPLFLPSIPLGADSPSSPPGTVAERKTWTSREDFEEAGVEGGIQETRRLNLAISPEHGTVRLAKVRRGAVPRAEPVLLREGVATTAGIRAAVSDGPESVLILWRDTRSGLHRIYGQAFTTGGRPLGEEQALSGGGRPQNSPAAAFNGALGEYLAVWYDLAGNGDVRARLLSLEGTPVGEEIVVAGGSTESILPAVAANPRTREFLVLWQEKQGTGRDILARRIGAGGVPAGGVIPVCSAPGDQTNPDVLWDGGTGRYLVVWEDGRGGDPDVRGRFVGPQGELAGEDFPISGNGTREVFPRIAGGGKAGIFLVTWEDYRHTRGGRPYHGVDIYGRILDGDGTPQGEEIAVNAAGGNQVRPAPVYDRSLDEFFVVWQDGRQSVDNWDLYGQRILPSGDWAGFVIPFAASSDRGRLAPEAVFHESTGETLLLWRERVMSNTKRGDIRLQRLGPSPDAEGILDGLIFDGGDGLTEWKSLHWNADLPEGTTLTLRTRTARSPRSLSRALWSPPSGEPGDAVRSPHHRWIEIGILLETSDGKSSPLLHSVTLLYSREKEDSLSP